MHILAPCLVKGLFMPNDTVEFYTTVYVYILYPPNPNLDITTSPSPTTLTLLIAHSPPT
jgi:hypothetical protein